MKFEAEEMSVWKENTTGWGNQSVISKEIIKHKHIFFMNLLFVDLFFFTVSLLICFLVNKTTNNNFGNIAIYINNLLFLFLFIPQSTTSKILNK